MKNLPRPSLLGVLNAFRHHWEGHVAGGLLEEA